MFLYKNKQATIISTGDNMPVPMLRGVAARPRTRLVRQLWRATAALALAGGLLAETAAQAYPAAGTPVRILVGATPGGATELVARFVAEVITQRMNGVAVVDFRTGAGGAVAAEAVARAKPDGYTLLVASQSALSVIPLVMKNVKYEVSKDFAAISLVASAPMILLASPDSKIQSAGQLVREIKARPDALNFGSSGTGTSLHLTAESFLFEIGGKARHVPYKGAGQALIDLGGSSIDWMFDLMPTGLAFAKTGKATPLAVTSAERSKSMPELPTLQEAGVPGFTWATWLGVVAPAGTPEAVLDALNREVVAALNEPEVIARLAKTGFDPQPSTRKEFADYIGQESARFAKIVKSAGITPE